jgi:hypothetical protein
MNRFQHFLQLNISLIDVNKTYSDIFFNKKIVGFEVIYKFATINLVEVIN